MTLSRKVARSSGPCSDCGRADAGPFGRVRCVSNVDSNDTGRLSVGERKVNEQVDVADNATVETTVAVNPSPGQQLGVESVEVSSSETVESESPNRRQHMVFQNRLVGGDRCGCGSCRDERQPPVNNPVSDSRRHGLDVGAVVETSDDSRSSVFGFGPGGESTVPFLAAFPLECLADVDHDVPAGGGLACFGSMGAFTNVTLHQTPPSGAAVVSCQHLPGSTSSRGDVRRRRQRTRRLPPVPEAPVFDADQLLQTINGS